MGAYFLPFGSEPGGGLFNGGLGMLMGLLRAEVLSNKVNVRLHTGNPGTAGTSNNAVETLEKEVTITQSAAITVANYENGRSNTTAATWTEVKEAETYKWISLRDVKGGVYVLAIELTSPITVAKGDTFVISIGKLNFKLLTS